MSAYRKQIPSRQNILSALSSGMTPKDVARRFQIPVARVIRMRALFLDDETGPSYCSETSLIDPIVRRAVAPSDDSMPNASGGPPFFNGNDPGPGNAIDLYPSDPASFTIEERRYLAAATMGPTANSQRVALKVGLPPQILYSWRRQFDDLPENAPKHPPTPRCDLSGSFASPEHSIDIPPSFAKLRREGTTDGSGIRPKRKSKDISREEKIAAIVESLQPNANSTRLAARMGVTLSMLYSWRLKFPDVVDDVLRSRRKD